VRLGLVVAIAMLVVAAGAAASPRDDGAAAEAARAIAHTFYSVVEIRPAKPGLFAPTTSAGYLDPAHGRGHWQVTSGGKLVAETVVDGGRVQRYDASSNLLTVASSCAAFASGCADVLDPLDLYRRALVAGPVAADPAGSDWQLTLHGVGDVEQVVTVDGTTYLPKLIEWRENGEPVSTVRIATLERRTTVAQDAFRLAPHPGARVRILAASGAPARVLSRKATKVPRGAYWLGARYAGNAARAYAIVTTAGDALRIDYGKLRLWNYDDYLPAEIVAGTTGFAKTIPLPQGGVARMYFNSSGLVVGDVEIGGRRVAVVGAGKIDIFDAIRLLRRRA
jgi:hypothetical protein